jgi:hypothetical protein
LLWRDQRIKFGPLTRVEQKRAHASDQKGVLGNVRFSEVKMGEQNNDDGMSVREKTS